MTATRPIGLANHASGNGDDDSDLAEWCRRLDIELRDPGDGDLTVAVAAAAKDRPPYVAVVGGDGTLRTAAPILAVLGVPMLPVPGGTFNHFAKANGIADFDAAAGAATGGALRAVPIARVNDEVFLNTCAIGWYPEMVRTRERLRERLPRPVAAAAAFLTHLPRLRRFRVEFEGRTRLAWLLWAGNGRFGTGPTDVAQRADIDGTLDVRLALAESRFARSRALWDLLRGGFHESDHLERFVATSPFTVRVGVRNVTAALDAEVVELRAPLTFTPSAQSLQVLVPPRS